MYDKTKRIDQKSEYITDLIHKQNGLKREDDVAFKYIYDITKFLVKRKAGIKKMSSEIPEEIVQNVVVQFSEKFSVNNSTEDTQLSLNSAFSYLSKCVQSELCKLNRNKYQGQSYIKSGYNFELESGIDETGEFSSDYSCEIEIVMNMERVLAIIIREIKHLIKRNVIPAKHKNFLFFPLLLALAREDLKIINKFDLRVRLALKQLYHEIGSPAERMK